AKFRRQGSALQLTDAALDAKGVRLAGELSISSLTATDPILNLSAHATLDDWQRLPGLPTGLVKTVHGGRLDAHVAVSGPASRLATAPATGDFKIAECEVRNAEWSGPDSAFRTPHSALRIR